MLDAAFQYDYAKNEWAQCTQPAYVQKDIEKLPHTLIVAYQNETAKDISALRHYVCCPLHHKMEEVKDADREHLVTVDGCVLVGLWRWEYFQTKTPIMPVRKFSMSHSVGEYSSGMQTNQ